MLIRRFAPGILCLSLLLSSPTESYAAYPSAGEVLHLSAPDGSPRLRLVHALSMNDREALREILESRELEAVVSSWHLARLAEEEGDADRAWKEAKATRSRWERGAGEISDLAPWFDRYQLALALDQEREDAAARILDSPLGDHEEDAIWWALQARWLGMQGDLSNSVLRFDRAWHRATRAERGDPAFGHRALAHLAARDPNSAAEAWLAYLAGLSWARDKTAALSLWDASEELRAAFAQSRQSPDLAKWLARNSRREEALAICLRAWREGGQGEAKEAYLLAVEQLYRLRQHAELHQLLAERRPRHLDREEKAALDAYPWGVRRRGGSSVEIARGFDEVAARYEGTPRAVEALWEAAWMWELSGELEEAEEHYLRYAQAHPRAPFARAAALRALYLPFHEERYEIVLERIPSLRKGLGNSAEEASALWLAARSASRLDQDIEADRWKAELRNLHQDSPFLESIPDPLQVWESSFDPEELFERQRLAFEALAQELGVRDLFTPSAKGYRDARLLLAWGFFEEGERQLEDLARASRRVPEVQLRCAALAWSAGRAERQARIGWWLRAVLKGRSETLDAHLDACFFPTPYAEAMAAGGARTGIAPGLLWGLMRRESFYEADVISRANAYGLLQLLPSTGQEMADRLGEPAVDDPRLLLDPRRNLRYGGEYLAQVLEETQGDVFQALAAYNAGESNGQRWKARLSDGAPAEELILLISYSETRAYVYHVLRHWELLGRIHPSLAP